MGLFQSILTVTVVLNLIVKELIALLEYWHLLFCSHGYLRIELMTL